MFVRIRYPGKGNVKSCLSSAIVSPHSEAGFSSSSNSCIPGKSHWLPQGPCIGPFLLPLLVPELSAWILALLSYCCPFFSSPPSSMGLQSDLVEATYLPVTSALVQVPIVAPRYPTHVPSVTWPLPSLHCTIQGLPAFLPQGLCICWSPVWKVLPST